ncbi:MAG: hypothetical protein EOM67_05935 [Spirochaetia bacterium]|nr:hypothetical protein [Spirochaetia bacterium]
MKWNKSVHERTLLLDAGNSLSGSEIANMNKGLDAATLYQTLGYDALSPSTAEFAFGLEHLIQGVKVAKQQNYLDILGANVTDNEGNFLLTPYKIYDLDGYNVAVIGLSFPENSVEDAQFYSQDLEKMGQQLVDQASQESDYVVLLSNLTPNSPYTAEQIAANTKGIDLIIDGKYSRGNTQVGETLIVSAGEKLTSVGVVELTLVNNTLSSVQPFEITKDDVASPQNSLIAQQFNITSIPKDAEVANFIASLQQELALQQAPKEEMIVEEPVALTEVAKEPEVVATEEEPAAKVNPLEIQPQKSITTSSETPAPATNFGVKTSFMATKDNVLSNNGVKVGLSINPYIHFNKARLGLQAYYVTSGSLFDPIGSDINNLNFNSGILGTARSILRFVDYFYYGEEGDNLFISMDSKSPITFNRGFLVNNYTPSGNVYKENMGLYASAKIGMVGIQTFFDDLYFTSLTSSGKQNGAFRVSFDLGSSFEIGVGSLVNANRSFDDVTLYPTLDASWLVVNKRTFQLELFGGLSTALDVAPFDIGTFYNASASGFSAKFPNFQVTGGLEMNTLKWNVSLIAAAQNISDPLLGYGNLNDTYFSGSRIALNSGIHFLLGAKTTYRAKHFSFDVSYYVPIEQDFSRIIPLNSDNSETGDNASIAISYKSDNFKGQIGIRRVGVLSGLKQIFTFDDGLQGFVDDSFAFIGEANKADPFIRGEYSSGPFSLYGDLKFSSTGISNLTIGSTIDIGTDVAPSVAKKGAKESGLDISVDLGTSFTRLFESGSDGNYLSFTPVVTMKKGNFSIGIGPKVTFNTDAATLYTHSLTSPFSFSSGAVGTFATTYDIATDVFGLLDHLQIGKRESGNYLSIGKSQIYSSAPFIKSFDTSSDSTLQDSLSLSANIDTKVVDLSIFINDLTHLQFGSMRLGVSPFKNYKGEFGLSGLLSAKLSASEKQFDVIPTLDITLPVLSKEKSSIALYGSFSTYLGYDSAAGFKQMFYNSSVPAFVARFNNYMLDAGINSTFNNFTLNLHASTQEGVLEQGLFNSLFLRERADIISAFDAQWTDSTISSGRTYNASIELGYDGKSVDLHGSYILPLTSSFALIEDEDLLHLGANIDIKNVKVAFDYSRRGFLEATKTFISSTGSLVDKTKTFVLTGESMASVSGTVSSGNLDLTATIGTYTKFSPDATYNGITAGATVPMFSVGANINLF